MTAAAANNNHGRPLPPPGFELTSGLAKGIKKAHEILDKIWCQRPNSPIVRLESKMIKGYSVARPLMLPPSQPIVTSNKL